MTSNTRKLSGHSSPIYVDSSVSDGLLRSPHLLARYPQIGVMLFILGSLIFGAFFLNLYFHGPLLKWDTLLAATLPGIALKGPPYLEYLMDAGFYLGKQVIMVIDALLFLYFLYKRYWEELVTITVGWSGAAVIFYYLSTYIDRPRSTNQIWIIVNIPGFPSGHAISVVVCYGLLAYWLVPKMPTLFWKWMVVLGALAIILFVGFSRIMTGGHFLTDILAGYAVGLAWSGLAYTIIERFYYKKKMKEAHG